METRYSVSKPTPLLNFDIFEAFGREETCLKFTKIENLKSH